MCVCVQSATVSLPEASHILPPAFLGPPPPAAFTCLASLLGPLPCRLDVLRPSSARRASSSTGGLSRFPWLHAALVHLQDQELLDIVKKLLSEQSSLSNSLTMEEISALKEQKALLEREVELRREATERAQAEARLEAERKAAVQQELDSVSAELAELKGKKTKACTIM